MKPLGAAEGFPGCPLFQRSSSSCAWKGSEREPHSRAEGTGAGLLFLGMASGEFPGRGWKPPGVAPFCVKPLFLLRLSPVIFLEPGHGLEGEHALAGVVRVPPCQANPSPPGNHAPLPQRHKSAASHLSVCVHMPRTRGEHPLFPSYPPSWSQEPGFLPV